MTRDVSVSLPGYEAAVEDIAAFIHPVAGYLRVAGPDRLAFLQRQTTNDLNQLENGRTLATVLTSPTARILDVFLLIAEPEAIGTITLPGYAQHTSQYLRSRIFFMDNVTVEDASAEFSQIELVGPEGAELLSRLGLEPIPGPAEARTASIKGVSLLVLGKDDQGIPTLGYRLLLPTSGLIQLTDALEALGVARLDLDSYHTLRIEAGQPAAVSELSEDYTPLEVGLDAVISGDKGCYTGQEVIARQITYDKVTRQLAGLRLDGPAEPGTSLLSADEDRPVGEVTSYTWSPRFGPIALGIIRRPFHTAGTKLHLGGDSSKPQASVVDLPFKV